jgi:nicotinate-nucleotide adenylyltransferase
VTGKPRIAVFGGTFDPVHLGHLIMAEQCREQARLDHVLFVPAARPPHKLDRALTPFAPRVEMLALALAGQPAFRIDEIENERPDVSYMAVTLEELTRRHPEAELHLILGSDSLDDLKLWYGPERVLAAAGLLVTERPGHPLNDPPTAALGELATLARLQVIESPRIEIASRDLRCRAAEGRSLRFLVPRAVECYIQEKRLYRPG